MKNESNALLKNDATSNSIIKYDPTAERLRAIDGIVRRILASKGSVFTPEQIEEMADSYADTFDEHQIPTERLLEVFVETQANYDFVSDQTMARTWNKIQSHWKPHVPDLYTEPKYCPECQGRGFSVAYSFKEGRDITEPCSQRHDPTILPDPETAASSRLSEEAAATAAFADDLIRIHGAAEAARIMRLAAAAAKLPPNK